VNRINGLAEKLTRREREATDLVLEAAEHRSKLEIAQKRFNHRCLCRFPRFADLDVNRLEEMTVALATNAKEIEGLKGALDESVFSDVH
jgi:hypothetical protein